MGEERQAAAWIGLVFLVGLVGLFLTGGIPGMGGSFASGVTLGDVYVDSYRADIYFKTQYPAACCDWDKGHTYST